MRWTGEGGRRLAEALFEVALHAFPREFRRRHGEGMRLAFRERHGEPRASRGLARIASLGLTLADVLVTGLVERVAGFITALRRPARGNAMKGWLTEARITLRGLLRTPVFTTQTVITVALGAVGVGAVYPVLYEVVLRPLPYHEPGRLVTVRTSLDRELLGVTSPELLQLARQTDLFEGVAAVLPPQYDESLTWTGRTPRERLRGIRATPGLMEVLGVDWRGPGFDPSPAAGDEVLLSDGFWRSRFAGDPSILGRAMSLNDRPYTVVGILPPEFEFPLSPETYDVWVAYRPDPAAPASTDNRVFRAVARLRPSATLEEAQAAIPGLLRGFHAKEATGIDIKQVVVRSLHRDLMGSVRTPLLLLAGGASMVLLVAALNVALLISARNVSRDREFAVRRALGAGRGRLARLLLTEAGILVVGGMVLGGVASGLALDWISSGQARGADILRIHASTGRPGMPSGVPALLGVLVAALGAAAVPALRASRADALTSRTSDARRGTRSAIGWIVGAESALVFGLLVAAALSLVTVEALSRVNPGFDPGGAVALEIQLPNGKYESTSVAGAVQVLEERLSTLSGVRAVGSITHLPLDENNWGGSFAIEGRTDPPPDALPEVDWEFASPGYFDAARIPIVEGRPFTTADRRDKPLVAIINETLARRYWPDGGAVGSRVNGNGFDGTWLTVVGVAGDVKQQGLGDESRGYLYMSSLQSLYWPERQVVVRTETVDALAAVPVIRQTLLDAEPDLTIGSVIPLGDLVRRASGPFRLRAALFTCFGLIAAMLGMAGIYGVASHGVRSRRHEVGIRLAMGADPDRIFRMVVADGMRPVLIGIAAGVGVVWEAGRWLGPLIYGIEPGSPVLMTAVAVLLLGAALCAIVPPALRVHRLDPVRVLRSD